MAQVQVTIECGYCLRKDEELPTPKILPCSHVHCMQCLCGFFEENHILVCPVQGCGEIVEGSPDNLPSYEMVREDNKCCDVCMDRDIDKQEAVIYCTVCSNKLCEKHQKSHGDTMDRHEKISIEETTKIQTRNCTKHEDQPYFMGCKLCLNLVCKKCLTDLDKCDNGASHSLLSLDDLVAALMKEDIGAEMMAKEDQYEKLFKETSKTRTDYDNKTTEMVQLIHNTRDSPEEVLKPKYKKLDDKKLEDDKYKKLEDEVMKKRQKSSVAMAEFMEDIVLRKWTQLRNHRKMIESRFKFSQQVDVVKGLKELKEETHKFVEEKLPALKLTDEVELKKLNVNGAVELEIVSSCDIVIDSESPQSMKLLKSVQLPSCPLSVCHYNGGTYVGLLNKTVTRIDNNYQLHNSFISTAGAVESICVYKDRLYALSYDYPCAVNVYDMSGAHITSWTHPYHEALSDMLTVVADPTNQRITVYSLTGESLHHIPCSLLSNNRMTWCAVDGTSVVISHCYTSKVFRVNITTGEVMWTLSHVTQPQGLARYGCYILLAAAYSKQIYILNAAAGEIVSEISDDAIAGYVSDLGVYDTTLVPLIEYKKVLFYQLNTR